LASRLAERMVNGQAMADEFDVAPSGRRDHAAAR
jgi:hypothetical protein